MGERLRHAVQKLTRREPRPESVIPVSTPTDTVPGRVFQARTPEADARITGEVILAAMRNIPDTRLKPR